MRFVVADSMAATAGLPLLGVSLLVVIHLLAGKIHRGAAERPGWLSAASGISVTYVFVHLLPELAEAQEQWLEARPERLWVWLESQVYVAALLGLVLALGLDRATAEPRQQRQRFWLHTVSFAIYNLLIGGLALRLTGAIPLMLAVVAFGAHFLVNDHSLHQQYGRGYERTGRWLLAGAILLGWALAVLWQPPVVLTAALLGVLSGGIILNVIKEELPREHEGRYRAFVLGVAGYTALLLALGYSLHEG